MEIVQGNTKNGGYPYDDKTTLDGEKRVREKKKGTI